MWNGIFHKLRHCPVYVHTWNWCGRECNWEQQRMENLRGQEHSAAHAHVYMYIRKERKQMSVCSVIPCLFQYPYVCEAKLFCSEPVVHMICVTVHCSRLPQQQSTKVKHNEHWTNSIACLHGYRIPSKIMITRTRSPARDEGYETVSNMNCFTNTNHMYKGQRIRTRIYTCMSW